MNAVLGPGPRGAPVDMRRLAVVAAGALLILSACEPPAPQVQNHPQWVIRSKVSFVEADLATAREPLPLPAFQLSFPYVGGHLYGAPSIADLVHVQLNPDYSFVIDLNRTQAELERSLQPTEFAEGEEYLNLRIDPADARIARLMPRALKPDGIEPIAAASWVDTRSHAPLILVYFDRAARITGTATRNGRTTRYNIRASQAGYVWIGYVPNEDGEHMYREVDRPEHLILALAPKTDELHPLPPETPQPAQAPASSSASASHSQSPAPMELRGAENPRQAAARERGTPAR
jgi:hypothetical protein